jgi:hypothetical protein
MALINAYLSVESSGLNLTTLLITDAYGHINGRLDLDPAETHSLAEALLALCPVDVEAVEVTEQETEQVIEQATDWEALTKAEIIERVIETYEVELDADDRKADLVAQAQDLERQAA